MVKRYGITCQKFVSPHHHVMRSSFYIESQSSWHTSHYYFLKYMSNIGINGVICNVKVRT